MLSASDIFELSKSSEVTDIAMSTETQGLAIRYILFSTQLSCAFRQPTLKNLMGRGKFLSIDFFLSVFVIKFVA